MKETELTQKTKPTIFIMFGATGDLALRKLLPALFELSHAGKLPSKYLILGVSRRNFTDKEYRNFIHDALSEKAKHWDEKKYRAFLHHIRYTKGAFGVPEDYLSLGERLVLFDEAWNTCANKLFYLAVPPVYYELIFKELASSGLTIPCSDKTGWTRVLVEKPFGNDLETARKLDQMLGMLFQEEQIFRIDHYLAKETVQDILTFRFSNSLFEPLWNSKYISHVEIMLRESDGVGGRGSFYDELGALRDVGQNHILQMLALIAMDAPNLSDGTSIREARRNALRAIVPITRTDLLHSVVRAQYRGYLREKSVKKKSKTETYFWTRTMLRHPRWEGVPFFLESGKALSNDSTEIKIFFRPGVLGSLKKSFHQNVLTFRIQPKECIAISFWVKRPGFSMETEERELSFRYKDHIPDVRSPDAYERVLIDAIRGDQTLFASTEEIEALWSFVTPILEHWHELPLRAYKKGSERPKEVEELIRKSLREREMI